MVATTKVRQLMDENRSLLSHVELCQQPAGKQDHVFRAAASK
jgi:hypothetical protein